MCALPPPKEEEKKFSCVEQKSQVKKKIRKTTEARKIAKLLYQKCVCSAWKMSLFLFLFLFLSLAYAFNLFCASSTNSAYCSSVGSGHPFSSK